MNILIWIITALLAAIFAMAGIMKLTRSKEQLVNSGLGWAADYPPAAIRLIAAAELLAALGLILTAQFGIAEILVPLAATGLAIPVIAVLVWSVAAVSAARRLLSPRAGDHAGGAQGASSSGSTCAANIATASCAHPGGRQAGPLRPAYLCRKR